MAKSLLLPLFALPLIAACGGGGATAPPDSGASLTTYAGFERENGRLLRFRGLLGPSSDAAPDATLALPEVDSVELNPGFLSPGTGGSITTD